MPRRFIHRQVKEEIARVGTVPFVKDDRFSRVRHSPHTHIFNKAIGPVGGLFQKMFIYMEHDVNPVKKSRRKRAHPQFPVTKGGDTFVKDAVSALAAPVKKQAHPVVYSRYDMHGFLL